MRNSSNSLIQFILLYLIHSFIHNQAKSILYGGKNWGAIVALVPGLEVKSCTSRWNNALDPSIDRANGRRVACTEDEGSKLKDESPRLSGI
jgi:hypothetical protein